MVGHGDPAQPRHALVLDQPPAHDIAQGRRLLADLLVHVVVVATLPDRLHIPGDDLGSAPDRAPGRVEGAVTVARQNRRVAVAQPDHPLRVGHHGGRVRSHQEAVAATDAQEDWTAVARDDDLVRIPRADDRDPVRALDAGQSGRDGIFQKIAVAEGEVDQVHQDFGVGLAPKFVAHGAQSRTLPGRALDDAVVDQGDVVAT